MSKSLSLFWEILRKAVHLAPLVIVVGYTLLLNYFSERVAILALTGLLLLFLKFEYLRVERQSRLVAMFRGLFRKHEENAVSGALFVLISCIICFAAFDYWVAVLALAMMVFGDIFSALFGQAFGKTVLYRGKTVVGTLAGFGANLAAGFLILPEYWMLVLVMAFVASFTELITIKLDDNLTVPLFAGFAGQMLLTFYYVVI